MRLSMDAPGSGHNGSVLCDRATGSSHWNPFAMKVEVRECSVWVITFPMQALRSNSVGDNWSSGFGMSARDMHGAEVSSIFMIVHFW